ncbi:hypothetical protein RhiirA4_487940 [Rhizophagus irregularis]|uniref:Uncharacterized protein n=1 Tax=Rhizophagus irregularis TaxID=588596 RepID=A0A2I1HT87_9GLOM|nr:hypothetical protein RhiirA4_487940 [Rhizophagus irregularis]
MRNLELIEEKIKYGALSYMRGSILEIVESFEFLDTDNQSKVSAVVLINKRGGIYAVRVVTYEEENDYVTIVLSSDYLCVDGSLETMEFVKGLFLKNNNSSSEEQVTQQIQSLVDNVNNLQNTIEQLEQELTNEKEHNQLLLQKIALEEDKRKLEAQLNEKNTEEEISNIRESLINTERKLVESKNELNSKQEEVVRMANQIEEIQKKEKESIPIKRLKTILEEDLAISFKNLKVYQNKETRFANSIPRAIINKIKISASDLGTISRGFNYVGGGLSTLGYAEIGGSLTLFGSTVDSTASEIEGLDKQKQEELVKLEGTCQELKKFYRNFSKSLIRPKKMDETISSFLELVNELQKSISADAKQKEINKKFEVLKEKGEEVENDLKKVIKNLEVETDSTKVGSSKTNQELENDNQSELQAIIIDKSRDYGSIN